jgi:hypothetical protein
MGQSVRCWPTTTITITNKTIATHNGKNMLSRWTSSVGTALRTLRYALFQVKSTMDRPPMFLLLDQTDESDSTTALSSSPPPRPPPHDDEDQHRQRRLSVLLQHSDEFVVTVPSQQAPTTTAPADDANVVITLRDYHRAFLSSPVFQTELWLLKMLGLVSAESISRDRLDGVAVGTASSFALWSTIHRQKTVSQPPTQMNGQHEEEIVVMRCSTPDGIPFCDTWWSVATMTTATTTKMMMTTTTTTTTADPTTTATTHYLLRFGTALVSPKFHRHSLLFRFTDPLHRLYNRILLASALDTLLIQRRKQQQYEDHM